MRPEQVRDVLSGFLEDRPAPDGIGAAVEAVTATGDERIQERARHLRAVE